MTPETPETTVAEALADFDVHDSASRDRLDTASEETNRPDHRLSHRAEPVQGKKQE